MIPILLGLALAGPPPCEPLTRPDFLEGDNFWVEWDPAVGDPIVAQQTLDNAEEARRVYIDELGYDYPAATVLIRIQQSPADGGLTSTVSCPDGSTAPHITLFSTAPGMPGQNTTMHEVVHATQYAYMGTYLDAIASWPWWMEGHATWLTWQADGNDFQQTSPAAGYLQAPWIGLHQGPTAYADLTTSRFLYGTVLLAMHLDREHGPDAIRQTWEVGGPQTGSPVLLPDTLEAIGIEFEPFWLGFMAETSVLDVPNAWRFEAIATEAKVSELPASGTVDEARRPGGLGLSVIHFRRAAGAGGLDLRVDFEGDPAVDWLAVLVRSRGKGPGGSVVETVELEVGPDGTGRATLANFDGALEGFLVVSPIADGVEGHEYSWSAELVAPDATEEKGGCGCAVGSTPTGWFALLGLFALGRRSRI